MHVRTETTEATEKRLRDVIRSATINHLEGEWWFREHLTRGPLTTPRTQSLALVRDGSHWSELTPVVAGDLPAERYHIWSVHFPPDADNSGFIGWLAAILKKQAGSGVLVVCGFNSQRGGIFDYWGCPVEVTTVVGEALNGLVDATAATGLASASGPGEAGAASD